MHSPDEKPDEKSDEKLKVQTPKNYIKKTILRSEKL